MRRGEGPHEVAQDGAAKHRLVDERGQDLVGDPAWIRGDVREAQAVVVQVGEAHGLPDPEPANDQGDDDPGSIADLQEQVSLSSRVNEEQGDHAADAEDVPGETAQDRRAPAANRLVVLGGAEPLGLEPEHHQEQRQTEPDEDPKRRFHVPALTRSAPAHASSVRSMARNASCGISTEPTRFIRRLPSFCFSSSFRFRVMSPP